MSPRDLVYVGHMLDMARKAVSKSQGISRETFDADENLRLALIHLIQITRTSSGRSLRTIYRSLSRRSNRLCRPCFRPRTNTDRWRGAEGRLRIAIGLYQAAVRRWYDARGLLAMPPEAAKRLFTTDEFRRMGDAGIFGADDRVELIDGEIIALTPIGPRHASCVRRLIALLAARVGTSAIVDAQNPIVDDIVG